MRPRLPALAVLLALCAAATAPRAQLVDSPCNDAAWARDFRARYPMELNRRLDDERRQQAGWAKRADEIAQHLVAANAVTPADHARTVQALLRSAPNAAFDAQALAAQQKFIERNNLLAATLPLARVDPLRPDLAWCLLATSALEALDAKVKAEGEGWALLDRELLADAAARGVPLGP